MVGSNAIRVLGLAALLSFATASVAAAPQVWLLELEGAISPATADYFISSLHDAQAAGATALVVRLDTPGGLDNSMRAMIKEILASTIPVVFYVSPNGSRAASAGTYLMYASHVAAMAPATNIGSSTPVSLGGGSSPFPSPTKPAGDDKADDAPAATDGGSAMERKVINDAVAYIRGLAMLRGRNAEWAEKTVRDAANLTANDALAENVIDLIAPDFDSLLTAIDGRVVTINGQALTLAVAGAEITRLEPGWRYELLAFITDPNMAYILLMVGIYGIILEFYNPGMGVPGVTGVICLLLAAYALQMLPVNYAGLALMLLGIALMVAEAFTPSIGVFGIGGAIAFVIGSIILMDTDLPAYQISIPIIAAFAASSIGVFLFAVGAALRARRSPVVTGKESMVGATASALADFDGRGRVRAFGEIWQADASQPIHKGAKLKVTGVDGLILKVEPQE
ncbi:MAG: nodulation protein NfeD [Gammaproteobacteria bacterium]|nr:nodulation protein NfeD [Gammaproteobacteria bacterium]